MQKIKKTLFLLTVILGMCAMVGCSSDDETEFKPYPDATVETLCGCSWTPGGADYLSFFKDGTFEQHTSLFGWRYLYKGVWAFKNQDNVQIISATYTKAYENGYETELQDKCPWDGSTATTTTDGKKLYLNYKIYSKTEYVAPDMTQYKE